MKTTYIALLISFFLFSCTKDITVLKNKNSGAVTATTPASLNYAVFIARIPTDPMPPINNAMRVDDKRFYSLSLDGVEQELLLEDGTSMIGNNFIDGLIQTKSGIILGVTDYGMESHSRIYKIIEGKTLKLIQDNTRIVVDYQSLLESYRETTESRSYFCSSKGIMMWDDGAQTLENVKETRDNQYCNGRQIKDEFYYSLSSYLVDGSSTLELGRVKQLNGATNVQVISTESLSTRESKNIATFAEINNKVIYLSYYQNTLTNVELAQFTAIKKSDLSTQVIYEKQRPENLFFNAIIFKNGKVFDGKIILQVDYGKSITPIDYSINGHNFTSSEFVTSQDVLTYDGQTVESLKHIEGDPFITYSLVNSKDSFFLLKNEQVISYNEVTMSFESTTSNSLLSMSQELVYQFPIGQYQNLHSIKGITYLSQRDPQESGGDKILIYSLPNGTEPVKEDSRLSGQRLNAISFLDFYDKVLFEARKTDTVNYETVSGFFSEDGIVRLINKFQALIGLFNT